MVNYKLYTIDIYTIDYRLYTIEYVNSRRLLSWLLANVLLHYLIDQNVVKHCTFFSIKNH